MANSEDQCGHRSRNGFAKDCNLPYDFEENINNRYTLINFFNARNEDEDEYSGSNNVLRTTANIVTNNQGFLDSNRRQIVNKTDSEAEESKGYIRYILQSPFEENDVVQKRRKETEEFNNAVGKEDEEGENPNSSRTAATNVVFKKSRESDFLLRKWKPLPFTTRIGMGSSDSDGSEAATSKLLQRKTKELQYPPVRKRSYMRNKLKGKTKHVPNHVKNRLLKDYENRFDFPKICSHLEQTEKKKSSLHMGQKRYSDSESEKNEEQGSNGNRTALRTSRPKSKKRKRR